MCDEVLETNFPKIGFYDTDLIQIHKIDSKLVREIKKSTCINSCLCIRLIYIMTYILIPYFLLKLHTCLIT